MVEAAVAVADTRDWLAPVRNDESLTQGLGGEAEDYLEQVALRLRKQGVRVQTRVILDGPAAAILEEADTQKADLICLATHGCGGARRLLLGSVADKAVRSTSTPVLVVRPSAMQIS